MHNQSIAAILPMLMLGASNNDAAKSMSLIISKKGKIFYYNSDGTKQKIKAGALVKNSGSIKLPSNSFALLFSNGQYLRLDQAGVHKLEDVIPTGGMKKLNFDASFSRYLMAAIDMVVHATDGDAWGELSGSKGGGDAWGELSGSKGGGDGWGELSGSKGGGDAWGELSGSKGGGDAWGELSGSKGGGDAWGELSGSKGGGDAWGDHEGRIVPILPFGKLAPSATVFQWSQPKARKSYVLEILDKQGGIVHSTEVKGNWAQVNLDSLPLKKDQIYAWRVDTPDDPGNKSTKCKMIITDESTQVILDKKLKKSDAYQLGDRVLNTLMEAVVLEEAEYFYEAHQRYEMVRQTNKKNNLVKLMQAAFYLRYQLKPRAQVLFRKRKRK